MNKKILITIVVVILAVGTTFASVKAQPVTNEFIDLPDNLVEPYEGLIDVIESDKKLIKLREDDIGTYTFLSQKSQAQFKSNLGDLTTELTGIENSLKDPTSKDHWVTISETKTKLYEFHNKIEEVNNTHEQIIFNEIYSSHLEQMTNVIKQIQKLLDSDIGKQDKYKEINTRMETVDDYIEKFNSDMSESSWVRMEEKINQLSDSIENVVKKS